MIQWERAGTYHRREGKEWKSRKKPSPSNKQDGPLRKIVILRIDNAEILSLSDRFHSFNAYTVHKSITYKII